MLFLIMSCVTVIKCIPLIIFLIFPKRKNKKKLRIKNVSLFFCGMFHILIRMKSIHLFYR